jgi:hypothetical protein
MVECGGTAAPDACFNQTYTPPVNLFTENMKFEMRDPRGGC